jgi:hypothetical protein
LARAAEREEAVREEGRRRAAKLAEALQKIQVQQQ